ncbi:MAG: hypothetical protein V2A56_12205 [bacterium]
MKTKLLLMLSLALVTVPALADDALTGDTAALSALFLRSADTSEPVMNQQEWNSATALPTDRRAFELRSKMSLAYAQDDGSSGAAADATSAEMTDQKNPGRALLLSAILPGAGELYAGSKLKAGFFFAVEIACWYGAVTYALRGNAKETSFQSFADDNWREAYYRSVEYTAAQDPNYPQGSEAFTGTSSEWANMTWQEKINYLPDNFTHELSTQHDQSYYENVGKYLTQFGYGWNDWINGRTTNEINTWAAANGYNWREGDGTSAQANHYIDMRFDSNQLLDRSATFFSVIMVNHVLSAMDAGFTVRLHNRRMARVEPTTSQIWHNDQPVATAGLAFRF